jgi:hypothetical protein
VLPREAIDTFLKKFEVQRVRDLRAAQQDAARALVEALERSGKPSAGEVDPFGD